MPDVTIKRIDELPAAESIGQNDLFVAEQSSTAKKVTWELIKNSFGGGYDVAFVTVGTSTSAEIEAAYQTGKAVFCVYTSNNTVTVFPLTKRSGATTHFFGGAYKTAKDELTITVRAFQCVNDVWGYAQQKIPSDSSSTPAALGTAAAGSSTDFSRADHVHAMPSASDVGAIPTPSSPSSGDFLCYNGSAWVATTLATWQGGSY